MVYEKKERFIINKILITGGAGFIGGNFIINQILSQKNKIINFDKLTYAANMDTLRGVSSHSNYFFIQGDICSHIDVKSALKEYEPDIIINFAAESHVDRSIDGPSKFIQTNIVGTSVLLEESLTYYRTLSARNKKKFIFLQISTDEVYGSLNDEGLFTEKTPYAPRSPYSASKASSDHLVRAWYHTYGLPTIITNCSNNYGPYQFPEKLIPLMILNCLSGKDLPIYGKGNNVRDWLYVKDHCNAIDTVIDKGRIGETYNIGGNNELANIDVVKLICNKMNKLQPLKDGRVYEELITFVEDRPGHDFRYAIDASKIERELHWKPKVSFAEGLENTINWYLDNKDWWMNINKQKYNQERLGVLS